MPPEPFVTVTFFNEDGYPVATAQVDPFRLEGKRGEVRASLAAAFRAGTLTLRTYGNGDPVTALVPDDAMPPGFLIDLLG